MSQNCEDQELLEGFLTETTELLEKVDDDLMLLEKTPADMDLLNRIFRSVHTVKGAASFLEFELLVKVTHKAEDVLNRLRKGELSVNNIIMDVILEAVDLVKLLVDDIKKDTIVERPINGTIGKLESVLADKIPEAPPAGVVDENPAQEIPSPQCEAEEEGGAPEVTTDTAPEPQPSVDREPPSAGTQSAASKDSSDKSTLRVDVKRVDDLMNQVGELVLERNRMSHLNSDCLGRTNNDSFADEFGKLVKRISFITSELQMQVLKMRLVPVGNVFRKFPRIIRNLARDLGKHADLKIYGEDTELDRSVVDEIGDPLIHLVRNSLDHALESAEERIAAGKPRVGCVTLSARHEGNNIIISIKDDGRGLDPEKISAKALEKGIVSAEQLAMMSHKEIFDLIFLPGFSTKEKVSDLSGRGVGMDVVKTNVRKLNGIIEVKSEMGKGSEFLLRLPLTLAIIQSLMVEIEGETYSIPLSAVIETLRVRQDEFCSVGGREVLRLRKSALPLMRLQQRFAISEQSTEREFVYIVVVGIAEKRLGLVVTRLLGQQEVAIKSLGNYLADVPGIAGSTILGDGKVALIVDPAKLIDSGEEEIYRQASSF
jgi:two-component system, chemotaxis family, sensor kinase CheA